MDGGVRNFFVNNFNDSSLRNDVSFLFEGYVLSELVKAGEDGDSLRFWRTKNREEVDLVLDRGGGPMPLEIKYKRKVSSSDLKGVRKFTAAYPSARNPCLVNLSDSTALDGVKLLTPFDLEAIRAF